MTPGIAAPIAPEFPESVPGSFPPEFFKNLQIYKYVNIQIYKFSKGGGGRKAAKRVAENPRHKDVRRLEKIGTFSALRPGTIFLIPGITEAFAAAGPQGLSAGRPTGRPAIRFQAMLVMRSVYAPSGALMITSSPTLCFRSAAPTGDSLEILFSIALDSVVPVIS